MGTTKIILLMYLFTRRTETIEENQINPETKFGFPRVDYGTSKYFGNLQSQNQEVEKLNNQKL